MSSASDTQTSESATIPTPMSLTSSTISLPTETQRALISHLRETGSIPELSSLLSDSLARTGWTDRVRALSLELLRNGTCDTFPELLNEVVRRAKMPKPSSLSTTAENANGGTASKTSSKTTGGATTNGTSTPITNGVNGSSAIAVSKEWSGGPDGLPDVRIPEITVEQGVDFLKEKIKDAVEAVDDDSD